MTIRNRLTLISSLTFGVVFVIASALVYYIFYDSSKKIIFNELAKTVQLTGIFYLEEDELSSKEHKAIRAQFKENIQNSEFKIYNAENGISYGNKTPDPLITPAILDAVRNREKVYFKHEQYFYYGIYYPDNQGNFVVFIKAENEFFQSQKKLLLIILTSVLCSGLIIILLVSKALSNIAYRPITHVINQVNAIEPHSLNESIISTNSNDEIQDLITTFNNLLSRLSDTFVIQKNFINYVSHEFKTPLAAISGNLEVFAQKERTGAEYKEVAQDALKNVYHIEEILNTLMTISGLRSIASENETARVDEIIWGIIDRIALSYPPEETSIQANIEVSHEALLSVKGNTLQLQLALYNIIENAVKYADHNPVKITLTNIRNQLKLIVQDFGRGIPENELAHINQPFFRGSNVSGVTGSGIGLSLATLIFRQHNISFFITSEKDHGTLIELVFPKL
ncbi:HAMP domain-containing sensor histidine kinase [Flavobacterium kingsejongi]|uniref:histidine kinase n=1 Tax=Flavobacterium kingsejongi TaxID=1678728 RepID=A0A2S1LR14_9FLAO|nr:HAMP domain-containing sensor histidine kinase [Flavobacterium kingsejongi]AWG26210.1 two-component sensor histidine kinase [Flavobacterium kingsejongi]